MKACEICFKRAAAAVKPIGMYVYRLLSWGASAGAERHGGPARNPMYWAIEDQSGCDMYGFRAERGAEEHLRRHLGGLPPISPYDGSLRRCGLWRKALDVSHLHR